MPSVCTALAVLLASTPGSFAIRKDNVQSDEQSHSSAMAEVAMNHMKAFSGAALTPAVVETFKTMREELAGAVTAAILADHQSAQKSISDLVVSLGNSTAVAVTAKAEAYVAHQAWVDTVTAAKDLLQRHEKTMSDLVGYEKDEQEKCATAVSLEPFKADVRKVTVECEISDTGNCNAEIESLKQKMQAEKERVSKKIQEARSKHAAAQDLCDTATALTKKTTTDAAALLTQYGDKIKSAVEKKGSRDLAMCAFGEKLKLKCADSSSYTARVQQINQVNGTEWSHPDRQQEWKTTKMTICMIDAFLKSHSLDSAEIQSCSKAETSVGTIDFKTEEVEKLMTNAKFTCTEQEVSFPDDWTVPAVGAAGVKSTQYVKMETKKFTVAWDQSNPIAACNEA